MKNMAKMMQQAQKMQSKMQEFQDGLNELEIYGTSGGGMVNVVISGKADLKKIDIDPSLVDPEDKEVLEDLIVAAMADAKSKMEAEVNKRMSEITGGMQLPPGMSLPF
ncbi:YbaB/EbfC family nucleoid-associated protein [Terasakiella sp. A23]|uniref:YbaB/EbfC family nucleoid-associated protein n=1 Tax=Terasakiella sp. FCG-A23 TaxID=3080561 RepID=UPI0029557E9B|nr:YbaB/EbfC family nucleoid-associated protein [Terasakiella sp. A23]MDV7340725.1 YbaB/EbfC family nucleoid-associated protein [Terasakiella sp. A23]